MVLNVVQIKKLSKNYFKSLQKKFEQIIPGLDPEKIHQFRVEYKRFRALLRMLSFYPGTGYEKAVSGKLKKAYHLSGFIRDLQLQQSGMKTVAEKLNWDSKAFNRYLDNDIKSSVKKLDKICIKRSLAKNYKKILLSVNHKDISGQFEKYIKYKTGLLQQLIGIRIYDDPDLHAIRKILKDLFYNLKIINTVKTAIPEGSLLQSTDLDELDELLNELGNFQDKCMAIALLDPCWLMDFSFNDMETLQQIRNTWISEKEFLKQRITEALKTLPVHNFYADINQQV